MKLPSYVLITHPSELKDKTIIMSTKNVCFGQVWKFTNKDDYAAFISKNEGKIMQRLDGYFIVVLFLFTWEDLSDGMIQTKITGMATFYATERIEKKRTYYKKYMNPEDWILTGSRPTLR